MATTITRPATSFLSAGGATVTGAASIHAALSDASDASYIRATSAGGATGYEFHLHLLTFAAVVAPAYSQFRLAKLNIRANASVNKQFYTQTYINGVLAFEDYINSGPVLGTRSGATHVVNYESVDSVSVFIINPDQTVDVMDVWLELTYNEAPVATVTAPAEGGTVTTSRPTISWTYADPELDVQTRYWVKVFTAAQYAATGFSPDSSVPTWESGERYGTNTSIVCGTDLVNATTYRAYVSVVDAESGNRYGPWDYNQFTVALDAPASPNIVTILQNSGGSHLDISINGRDNILSADQASFETTVGDWVTFGGVSTVARSTAQAADGVASMAITATTTGLASARTSIGVAGLAVVAGKTYHYTVAAKCPAGVRSLQLQVGWYNAAGTLIGAIVNSTAMTPGTVSFTTGSGNLVAPALAVFASLRLQFQPVAAGEICYVDKVGFLQDSTGPWSRGGLVPNTFVTLERREYPGGVETWVPVNDGTQYALGATQSVVITDDEAPLNTNVGYRARTHAVDGASLLVSDVSTVNSGEITTGNDYIKSSLYTLAAEFKGPHPFKRTSREDQAAFHPIGRTTPIIVADVIRAEEFTLTYMFTTKDQFDTWQTYVRNLQEVMLLQFNDGQQWWVRYGEEVEINQFYGEYTEVTVLHRVVDEP